MGTQVVNEFTNVNRSYYVFNLSEIPDNATITKVTVKYNTSRDGKTFKLTRLMTEANDLQANWLAIGNSSSLHTGIPYGNREFVSDPIKTAIQNALSSDRLIIGALSESENDSDSYSNLSSIFLDVEFTSTLITITVRNDLFGADGGYMGVNIYPNSPISRPNPYTI